MTLEKFLLHRSHAVAVAATSVVSLAFALAFALAVPLAALASPAVRAADAMPAAGSGPASTPPTQAARALRLQATPSPLAARFSVAISQPPAAQNRTPLRAEWYFVRDTRQVALLKGAIDEAWHRDEQGRVRFERVFHDDQRAVDYSVGELATLGVRVDWAALSTFVDPRDLLPLKLVSIRGRGVDERVQLRGSASGETLVVDWMPALQLPAKLVRTSQNGAVTRIELQQHFSVAPASWPVPGARAADYLRLDAADFGDMDHEAVVKKSEALDIRLGWRAEHKHN